MVRYRLIFRVQLGGNWKMHASFSRFSPIETLQTLWQSETTKSSETQIVEQFRKEQENLRLRNREKPNPRPWWKQAKKIWTRKSQKSKCWNRLEASTQIRDPEILRNQSLGQGRKEQKGREARSHEERLPEKVRCKQKKAETLVT